MGWPKTVQPVLSKELSQDLNVRLDTTRRHRSLPALISGSQELGRPMRVLWLAMSPRGYVTEGSYPPRVLKEFNNLHTSSLGWGQFRRTWRQGGKQLHIERLSVSCWYLLTEQLVPLDEQRSGKHLLIQGWSMNRHVLCIPCGRKPRWAAFFVVLLLRTSWVGR